MPVRPLHVRSSVYPVDGGVYPGAVPAPSVVDDWNDEDFAGWTGSTGVYAFNTTDPIEGAATLVHNTETEDAIASTPGDGLGNYFPKGNIARIYVRSDEIGDSDNRSIRQRVRFGYTDSDNYYQIQINWAENDNWFLMINDQGGFNVMDSDQDITGDLAADTVYEIQIKWDDGTLGGADNDITCQMREAGEPGVLSSMVANNSVHATAEGVGVGALSSGVAATLEWDYYVTE